MLIAVPRTIAADSTPATAADQRQQAMIARFDADGDGKLNEAEKAAAKTAMQERREGRDGGPFHAQFMKQYDADKDGKLSDAEKAQAQSEWKAFVAKHDKDGDGKLSRDEGRAAHEAWAKEHPEAAQRMKAAADRDGDGTVSPKERRQAAKEIRQKRKDAGSASAP